MTKRSNALEVLAPVGNVDNFYAAVDSGADAVYLGLPRFNARMKADNITEDNIRDLVIYAHTRDCKVYVTLNTLVWDEELDDVIKCIDLLVSAKVDAFIVQDYAIVHILTSRYKGIAIHASTQMGIHNLRGAMVAESMGISRVVLSREAKLEDIIAIRDNTSLEIEYFVQGALCVAFSGNCYFSALRTGCSGNRGECKQLCRMPYTAKIDDTTVDEGYLLSARDLCLIPRLRELVDAGVTSFKIEGRLRRASYVALATRIYKDCLESISRGRSVSEKKYIRDLSKVFNRGNYIDAYLDSGTPDTTINKHQQNHIGESIGSVVKVSPFKNELYKIELSLSRAITKNDGLKFMLDGVEVGSLGVGNVEKNGSNYIVFSKRYVKVGSTVHLCVDNEFEESLIPEHKRIPVVVDFQAKLGQYATFTIKYGKYISYTARSENVVDMARSCPISRDNILDTISKLTKDIEVTQSYVDIDDNIFIVKSVLNELRRSAETGFMQALIDYKEKDIVVEKIDYKEEPIANNHPITKSIALVHDDYDISTIIDKDICVSFTHVTPHCLKDYMARFNLDKVYVYMPVIANGKDITLLDSMLSSVDKSKVVLVANNIYTLDYIREGYKVLVSQNMNVANSIAYNHLLSYGAQDIVWSIESSVEGVGLGYEGKTILMTLAHCPYKTIYGNNCKSCSYDSSLKICTPTSEYKVGRIRLSQCYFELQNDENTYTTHSVKLVDYR